LKLKLFTWYKNIRGSEIFLIFGIKINKNPGAYDPRYTLECIEAKGAMKFSWSRFRTNSEEENFYWNGRVQEISESESTIITRYLFDGIFEKEYLEYSGMEDLSFDENHEALGR